jgi:hypothetical protein
MSITNIYHSYERRLIIFLAKFSSMSLLFQALSLAEGWAICAGCTEYFLRRQMNTFYRENFTRTWECGIPGNFEMRAFQAVWRFRGDFH